MRGEAATGPHRVKGTSGSYAPIGERIDNPVKILKLRTLYNCTPEYSIVRARGSHVHDPATITAAPLFVIV